MLYNLYYEFSVTNLITTQREVDLPLEKVLTRENHAHQILD